MLLECTPAKWLFHQGKATFMTLWKGTFTLVPVKLSARSLAWLEALALGASSREFKSLRADQS